MCGCHPRFFFFLLSLSIFAFVLLRNHYSEFTFYIWVISLYGQKFLSLFKSVKSGFLFSKWIPEIPLASDEYSLCLKGVVPVKKNFQYVPLSPFKEENHRWYGIFSTFLSIFLSVTLQKSRTRGELPLLSEICRSVARSRHWLYHIRPICSYLKRNTWRTLYVSEKNTTAFVRYTFSLQESNNRERLGDATDARLLTIELEGCSHQWMSASIGQYARIFEWKTLIFVLRGPLGSTFWRTCHLSVSPWAVKDAFGG